jgi:hypothetical protein
MNETSEFTIREYLRQVAPGEEAADKRVITQMCELLRGPVDTDSCEGSVEQTQDMCDVETDTTYSKSELDWAYQRVH